MKGATRAYETLTPAELRAYRRALSGRRNASYAVQLADQNERRALGVSSMVTTAQVDVDTTVGAEDPWRQFDVDLDDPKGKIRWDHRNPSAGHVWVSTFIEAFSILRVEGIGYVSTQVFSGPIASFERDAKAVELSAVGKEHLALDPYLVTRQRNFPAGTPIVKVIEQLMRDMGERMFSLPKLKAKLTEKLSVARGDEAWKVCRRLAQSINRILYYDRRGYLCLRSRASKPTWRFTWGDNLVTAPRGGMEFDELRNGILVLGAKLKSGAGRARYMATPEASHPLSPQSLSRRGTPRTLLEVIENDQIKTNARAREVAEDELHKRITLAQTIDMDVLATPHLDERDLLGISAPFLESRVPFQRCSMAMDSVVATLGVNRRRRLRKRTRGGRAVWR